MNPSSNRHPSQHPTSHRPTSHHKGFTLLELLIVIGMLGVLTAVGFNNFATYRQTQRINETRSTVAVALERARQYARRYNVSYTVTFNADRTYASSTKNAAGTAITTIAGPPLTTLPQVSGTLPSDMGFTTNADGTGKNLITYVAPFARVNSAKGCIGIGLSALGRTFGSEIHIVGVTGRVVSRRINTNQTAALCPSS